MTNSTRYKIPAKYVQAIREVYEDSDGIWILLNAGYIDTDMDAHVIHVYNGKQLRTALTYIGLE